jgi:hypothetical protein
VRAFAWAYAASHPAPSRVRRRNFPRRKREEFRLSLLFMTVEVIWFELFMVVFMVFVWFGLKNRIYLLSSGFEEAIL